MKTTAKKPTAAQQAVIDRVKSGYFATTLYTETAKGYVHVWLSKTWEDGNEYIIERTFNAGEYKALCNAIHAGYLPKSAWLSEDITINWENSNSLYELHREGVREATRALNDY